MAITIGILYKQAHAQKNSPLPQPLPIPKASMNVQISKEQDDEGIADYSSTNSYSDNSQGLALILCV